ncbi:uncharacterized protein LOC34624467 [Cyclospora cayetanensis]|uniref:Uncharacterized protein LOC34624467 n=1 Tax=Cyclospora cayetanensis TaxID=88456 RepID=A0A6P6RWH0_9EIME|nr:uncharacterized protein LOC34624467 [Cyclospora cayetanensis]
MPSASTTHWRLVYASVSAPASRLLGLLLARTLSATPLAPTASFRTVENDGTGSDVRAAARATVRGAPRRRGLFVVTRGRRKRLKPSLISFPLQGATAAADGASEASRIGGNAGGDALEGGPSSTDTDMRGCCACGCAVCGGDSDEYAASGVPPPLQEGDIVGCFIHLPGRPPVALEDPRGRTNLWPFLQQGTCAPAQEMLTSVYPLKHDLVKFYLLAADSLSGADGTQEGAEDGKQHPKRLRTLAEVEGMKDEPQEGPIPLQQQGPLRFVPFDEDTHLRKLKAAAPQFPPSAAPVSQQQN